MTDNGNVVELIGVEKSFGAPKVLHDIDLSIREGEILTLLGPSGCGKSTLMRIVAGFEKPSTGEVRINGQVVNTVPPERRPVNMVFQRYALFPHLDVFDNVAFGLRLKKMPKKQVHEETSRMLDLVQLSDYADRWIGQISGGQAQRVALARALVNKPSVLLLDEPLAALDLKIRQYMVGELRRIHQETGTTFLYVTHDQDEAMMLSDRIVLINKGRIEQIGTPETIYSEPKTLFSAQFLGETNIVPGRRVSANGGCPVYETPFGRVSVGHEVGVGRDCDILSIRPESISINAASGADEAQNAARGRVTEVMFIGSRILYWVRVADDLVLKCQEHRPVAGEHFVLGDEVVLSWNPTAPVALSGK